MVEGGRGSLPFALIHGEPLVACAAWAVSEAGVSLVDATIGWSSFQEAGEPLVLHDPLCPMTPVEFVAECLATAVETDEVVVAVRPVTDTVKTVADGLVSGTVDRDGLLTICSPVVLPAGVVAALDDFPDEDFPAVVQRLSERFGVRTVEAPAAGRRVTGPDDVRLLEALTADSAGPDA